MSAILVEEETELESVDFAERELRVAVIGVGQMGRHHARIYSALPAIKLVGVCDMDLARAKRVASEFGTEALPDYRALLAGVDAVTIAVPTEAHAEVACEFLAAGIDVLLEKPISRTLEEADQIIQSAHAHEALLFIGHLERFNPALRAVAPIVHKPQFFEAHRLGSFSERSLDIDVIMDLMVHDLDIISSLVSSPPRTISAVGIPVLTHRLDIANARIEFQNGCVANITASRISKERVRKLRFFQPFQYVSIDYTQQEAEVFTLDSRPHDSSRPEILHRYLEVEKAEPLRLEIVAFLNSVRARTAPPIDGPAGRRALSLALDVRAAIDGHTQGAGEALQPPP